MPEIWSSQYHICCIIWSPGYFCVAGREISRRPATFPQSSTDEHATLSAAESEQSQSPAADNVTSAAAAVLRSTTIPHTAATAVSESAT